MFLFVQGQKVAMFNGKPICEKCDRFFHAPLPVFTKKPEPAKVDVSHFLCRYRADLYHPQQKPYEEPEAYKEEVIHDGRALLDYPAHLPFPEPGCGVRRIQVPDEEGGMRYKFITRRVDPKK